MKVRSESGDPVQLSDVRPVACASLTRVGGRYDGGYVVPREAIEAAGALLSFGLSHNWSFERDFKGRNPRAVIHCYDHTVSLLTALTHSVGQLARFLVRVRPQYWRGTFTWLDYVGFFRGDVVHFRQRIWNDRSQNSATIDDAFARLPPGSQVFVKMDIEGSEYRILDDLLRHTDNIVAVAAEFHQIGDDPKQFNTAIERLKRGFHLVHVHANNMGGLTPFHFPNAPEISFLSKRFFDKAPPPSNLIYPVPGLDRPNHPALPDFQLEF